MPIFLAYLLTCVGAVAASLAGVALLAGALAACAAVLVLRTELRPVAEKAQAYAQALADNNIWRTDP